MQTDYLLQASNLNFAPQTIRVFCTSSFSEPLQNHTNIPQNNRHPVPFPVAMETQLLHGLYYRLYAARSFQVPEDAFYSAGRRKDPKSTANCWHWWTMLTKRPKCLQTREKNRWKKKEKKEKKAHWRDNIRGWQQCKRTGKEAALFNCQVMKSPFSPERWGALFRVQTAADALCRTGTAAD